ncbi:MAG: efflux transporter outer membrane subunit [Telluria sp.]
MTTRLTLTAIAATLAACSVGPAYQRPATPEPAAFKEAGNWVSAAPADALERGPWWNLFSDPVLDQLMAQVNVDNQNIAAAAAAYAQARALAQEARADLFPALNLTAGADRSGGGGSAKGGASYRMSLGGSWEPDLWGRVRGAVGAAEANAQASAADLAGARLSMQGELAANYISLRLADAQRALLATTIAGYQRNLEITRNRYNVGIVAHSDLLQAQSQLATVQSDALGLDRQRATLEHAIAVLVGKAPADFALPALPAWQATVPDIPVGVPSTLLQRRPDIAAAERRVAAANAQIGVARAAYFPNIGLTASYGTGGSSVSNLFSASNAVWSLGLSAAQSIFNAGATRAHVAGAQAAWEAAGARYRQTVLAAFADVENELSAAKVLAGQLELQRQASQAADLVEQQIANRYRAGLVSYSEVVQAQATALAARRALAQAQADRQAAAVALIQSLGGGWHAP